MSDIAYTGQQDHANCQANKIRGEDALREASRIRRMIKREVRRQLKLKPKPRKRFGDFFPSRFTKSQWRHNRRGAI